jgi:hypothetical protein
MNEDNNNLDYLPTEDAYEYVNTHYVSKIDYYDLVNYVEDIAKKMNLLYEEVRKSKTIKINKLNEIFDKEE